ncbi:hypothetical protein [Euzebya pacifica]|uniref:hypothetical protein n=1 Tax=Euzebya pacifica TaxID=1608957 RepID=UPI0013E0509D|nr:hypothetical protein [Euzebya pacifica]
MVQTDLRFVVATGTLSGAIGSVTLQLHGRCGTQLAGTADRRWAFKAEEGAVVDRLQRPFLAAHPTIFGPAV